MQKHGFTLIELMVSIALLLVIMVGVNIVFKTTSDTIGAGQTQSSMMRDTRAIQATLNNDFGAMASDGASIIIKSEQLFAFNSPADAAKDLDGLPNTVPDITTGADTATQAQSGAIYNSRSHRLDRVSFFTRHLQRRQTGNNGTYLANQSSLEQWVWLGHVRVPDNSGNFFFDPPTNSLPIMFGNTNASGVAGSNPNAYYANQWDLGRVAMQLIEPSVGTGDPTPPAGVPGYIKDTNLISQDYMFRSTGASSAALSPLDTGVKSTTFNETPASPHAAGGYDLQESRYDLAGTSIAGFSTLLTNYLTATPAGAYWTQMMAGPTSRFQVIPFPTRPITSVAAAKMAPILTTGVSQFIVEFAGDFVSQQDDGTGNDGRVGYTPAGVAITSSATDGGCYFNAITPALLNPSGQDGKIDFVVNNASTPATETKSIRWYGMPRSTTGNATINATNGDVCPLRDTIRNCAGYAGLFPPIEKTSPGTTSPGPANNLLRTTNTTIPTDYVTQTYSGGTTGGMSSGTTGGFFYIAAWGPTDTVRPKLYRITMTLEDPNGRLQNGQTYEYVYAAP